MREGGNRRTASHGGQKSRSGLWVHGVRGFRSTSPLGASLTLKCGFETKLELENEKRDRKKKEQNKKKSYENSACYYFFLFLHPYLHAHVLLFKIYFSYFFTDTRLMGVSQPY